MLADLVLKRSCQVNDKKKYPRGGAFEQLFGTGGWEFDHQKSKHSYARGIAPEGGRGGGGGVC